MSIHWGSLLDVVGVSLAAAVAVVALVALAVRGLSARTAPASRFAAAGRQGRSPAVGTALAAACLAGAAAIVLFGLWAIVAR